MKCTFFLYIVPCIVCNKVFTNEGNGTVEILNSSIDQLDEFTICGRFWSPFLATSKDPWQQVIFKDPIWMLAKLEFRWCKDSILLNFKNIAIDFLSEAVKQDTQAVLNCIRRISVKTNKIATIKFTIHIVCLIF